MRVRVAAPLAALALLATACASDDGESAGQGATTTAGAVTTAAPATVPVPSRTDLVIGYGADDYEASEANRKRFSYHPLQSNLCETLVNMTPEFAVVEGLATSWEFTGDNTFRFHLREGVTFHNGEPLDADAVKYTMDYTTESPATSGRNFLDAESTTVVDASTVDIRPNQPNLRLIEQINHPALSILAPGSDPLTDFNTQSCTGPFMLESYTPGESLTVVRNDDYWGTPPQLERITFRFIPDQATRALALQNGDVDMIVDVDRAIVGSLETQSGIEVVRAPPGQTILIYIAQRDADGTEKVTADVRVRKAMAHAIDRETFVDGVLDGNGDLVNTVNPPVMLGDFADLVEGIPYDPDAAAALLDEAGWTLDGDVRTRDGENLTINIIYDVRRISQAQAEFVQAELAAVGFDAKIDQLEFAAYRERLNIGDYHLDFSAPNQVDANPAFLMALRWFTQADGANVPYIAPGADTEFEALIAKTLEVTDPDELREIAAMAMHELIDIEVGGLPLAGTYRIFAMNEDIGGFEPHASLINQRWDTMFWER